MFRSSRNLCFILTVVVLGVNLVVSGLLAYALYLGKEQREREVTGAVENVATLLDHDIVQSASRIDLLLRDIADELERYWRSHGRLDRSDLQDFLAKRQDWLFGVADFRVTDASGLVRYGPPYDPVTISFAERKDFLAHRNGESSGLIVTNPFAGPIAGSWLISFSRRYVHPDGSFGGMVTAAVPLTYFAHLLLAFEPGPNGIALLRDADGAVIARYPATDHPSQQVGSNILSAEEARVIASGLQIKTLRIARMSDDAERIVSYHRLTTVPFHLIVGMAPEDYLEQWHREVGKGLGVAIFFLIATSASAWLLQRSVGALQSSEERYRTVFQTTLDAVTLNRASDGAYLDVNKAFTDITGYRREEVIGRTAQDIRLWADPRRLDNLIEALRQEPQWRDIEAQFRKKNGELIWGLMSISVIELHGVRCVLSITRDISDIKVAQDEIKTLAFYDPLTGLPNRRLLTDRLRQAIAGSARSGQMRALLFVDLDNFKNLNDTLGHEIGDRLLQQVAQRLRTCVRETDTVARLGGDEFLVILDELSGDPEDSAAHAASVGEKVLSLVAQPYRFGDRECRITTSIGITMFGKQREEMGEILKQSDIAMYQAKAAGRNTIRFFAPALQAAINARASMEEDLRQGLADRQFLLFYQPQVDRGGMIGAEALIRWNHPERGWVSPADFIPLAEETGLILPLGNWVLETACRQLAAWAGRPETRHISLAINVSARQFRQPDFVRQVAAVLDRTGADPNKVKLELTESMLLDNVEDVIAKMSALKEHGLSFSLDDFGTGYSSLSYLKRLPLDQLKIDQSFVRDTPGDINNAAIARTIVALGKSMGLSVIAEGVETAQQRDFLAGLGCHSFQGYLFGRPMPIEQFEVLLAEFGFPIET